MTTQIYLHLPVKDLSRARGFFEKLGFTFEPRFTNDQAACVIVSETIYVMLLEEPFFQTFTQKPICDAQRQNEVLISLSCASRERVDELVSRARDAGGKVPRPAQDHGVMYSHGFEDLDGHVWELMYMDPTLGAKPVSE